MARTDRLPGRDRQHGSQGRARLGRDAGCPGLHWYVYLVCMCMCMCIGTCILCACACACALVRVSCVHVQGICALEGLGDYVMCIGSQGEGD